MEAGFDKDNSIDQLGIIEAPGIEISQVGGIAFSWRFVSARSSNYGVK